MKKRYLRYLENNLNDINGKKVIITGANSGIGFTVADILLYKGASIVMECRNEKKALEAKNLLLSRHQNAEIEIEIYDQSNIESISQFVEIITTKHHDFYALFLNAGIFKPGKDKSYYEKIPLTIGVNYLSVLYLLDKLQPFLLETKTPKRVIVEGSLASYYSKYKHGDLLNFKSSNLRQYNLSKLGASNVLMHFAKNNKNYAVKYGLSEPGVTASNLFRNFPRGLRWIIENAIRLIFNDIYNASFTTANLICNVMSNADYNRPRSFLSIKGKPKYYPLPSKLYNEQMIKDGYNLLEDIYERS